MPIRYKSPLWNQAGPITCAAPGNAPVPPVFLNACILSRQVDGWGATWANLITTASHSVRSGPQAHLSYLRATWLQAPTSLTPISHLSLLSEPLSHLTSEHPLYPQSLLWLFPSPSCFNGNLDPPWCFTMKPSQGVAVFSLKEIFCGWKDEGGALFGSHWHRQTRCSP